MGLEAITLWLRVQKLAKPAFDGLLDTVSNRILSLALELREQLGTVDDKTEKLEPAGVDRSIVYHIYGGNDVIAANGGNKSGLSYPYSSLCVVWLNTTTGIYHFKGMHWCDNTASGEFYALHILWAAAMMTLFGSAMPCKRAARFGVSPTTACS